MQRSLPKWFYFQNYTHFQTCFVACRRKQFRSWREKKQMPKPFILTLDATWVKLVTRRVGRVWALNCGLCCVCVAVSQQQYISPAFLKTNRSESWRWIILIVSLLCKKKKKKGRRNCASAACARVSMTAAHPAELRLIRRGPRCFKTHFCDNQCEMNPRTASRTRWRGSPAGEGDGVSSWSEPAVPGLQGQITSRPHPVSY